MTSDSFTTLSSLPAVIMPPCSLTEVASSCNKAPEPLSVKAAFQGKNVLITGAQRSLARLSSHSSKRCHFLGQCIASSWPEVAASANETSIGLLQVESGMLASQLRNIAEPAHPSQQDCSELMNETTWCEKMLNAGATGFVGSVTMEQVLRICPGVSKIFLLIRSKAGRSGESLAASKLCSLQPRRARQSRLARLITVRSKGGREESECGPSFDVSVRSSTMGH